MLEKVAAAALGEIAELFAFAQAKGTNARLYIVEHANSAEANLVRVQGAAGLARARGFIVAGPASRIERRGAGHDKTKPAAMPLTTSALGYRSGACRSSGL